MAMTTASDTSENTHVTPVMARYIELKTANPGFLLFYRMGDFYELFFDDAVIASGALGIALTKRGQHKGVDIAMAGVPAHAAEDYLHRLIAKGYRVAICEQMEDPADAKKRGSKAVVHRDVVRLITPGTLTEDKLLIATEANYLLALARTHEDGTSAPARFGLAWLDLSTGDFRLSDCDVVRLGGELTRIAPREIVVAERLMDDPALKPILRDHGAVITPLIRADHAMATSDHLADFFGPASIAHFQNFSRAEIAAASAIITYIAQTQLSARPILALPSREGGGAHLEIDAAARLNLELVKTLAGERKGSLLSVIDRTVTAAGSRELGRRLAAPLTDTGLINERLATVTFLVETPIMRGKLRAHLANAPDLMRSLARLALNRSGPRDLAALRDGLAQARQIAGLLLEARQEMTPATLVTLREKLSAPPAQLIAHLTALLAEELPLLRRDGGFVRPGFDANLDEERRLRDDARSHILALQARYGDETAIKGLKIKHNNVLGYFVEVGAASAERLFAAPLNAQFFHRQTLANQARFTTNDLSELEAKISRAAERALALEQEAFDALAVAVLKEEAVLRQAAAALADIDVYCALAELAATQGWARPTVDQSLAFSIHSGRHPVVEAALKASSTTSFVANDCDLGPIEPDPTAGRVWLLTGPNMAGKSTFLRQNALIAILAQMGSFVPARAAHIGVVDRLYSRVGAADDLARGRSTFMVEMVETATILNQASARSLVILDEIGRGTATFDGLSIAWASIEHLHNTNRCRTLFATHFHELTALAARLARLVPTTMKVKEWKGDVVFLHEVGPGTADRSYGIQVAKLAGLPLSVIERARNVLAKLEEGDRAPKVETLIDDLPLFGALRNAPPQVDRFAPLIEVLAGLDPDAMTPRQAHDALYELLSLYRRKNLA